ncbi:hypothetical protein BC936DRAFT_148761 [Jimgerdemannia flammicorona]|uniref:Methyltransferase type 11 domain-containing protein n=1 Tax=Jimgerdemannia flammicorona TaxID=994334 RepID=A0A433D2C0_9FUNG|nr:hypothetical protein BC936DRAFT_148761 [Jimgerdemannia flammicorona]
MLANTLEDLPFPDETFDYVFQRFMVLAFTPQDWRSAVNELVRLTNLDGWVELFELACAPERAPADMIAFHGIVTLCTTKGIDHTEIWRLKPLLMAHNFHNVESDYISCPLGWGGRVGEMHANNIHLAYLALGPVVTPVLGVDQDEYSIIVQRNGRWIELGRGSLPLWAVFERFYNFIFSRNYILTSYSDYNPSYSS